MNVETLRDGLFNLNTRRFGAVAELLIQRLAGLHRSRSGFHDLYNGVHDKRVEVKFSRVLTESKIRISRKTVLQCIEAATSEQRIVAFSDWKESQFDCNIQQVKRAEFDMLFYGLFFSDRVLVFRITSEDIGPQVHYSDVQHKGNVGEGQFHLTPQTLQIHLDRYLYRQLTYEELLDLLSA